MADAAGSDLSCKDTLQDLPPSAKLVFKVLQYEGPLTAKSVAEKSLLPDRTTRSALQRLESAGIVNTRHQLADARKVVYSLKPPTDPDD